MAGTMRRCRDTEVEPFTISAAEEPELLAADIKAFLAET
jgi:hypothetical protein